MLIETVIQKDTNMLSYSGGYPWVPLGASDINKTEVKLFLEIIFMGEGHTDLNMDEHTGKENIYYYFVLLER